jgi:DeoR family transcriptional regulator, fructose operon transcriptional repressor
LFVEERHQKILDLLRTSGKVSVESLTEQFSVSAPTIRADLASLDLRGLLRRTHGGAMLKEQNRHEATTGEKDPTGSDDKRRIARVAASRVKDHETILLDAGTTVHEIARVLRERRRLTIVTNSLPSAFELAECDGITVVLIGGELNSERQATLGPLATEFLRDIHVDRAFIGVNGVSEDAGWTVVDFDAVQLKRAMMSRAREVIVVADHSKLGEATFASIGPLTSAQALVTDTPIEHPHLRAALEAAGVEIIQCSA